MILEGEYFLWVPKLYSPAPGVLDIAPESCGLLEIITPNLRLIPLDPFID
jgi:hypothetical protein